jgi:deoxyribodipyrimidine photo-lyase
LEQEVLAAVLREHTPTAADKFIQELSWRTYWKGWLEMRPQVWDRYRTVVDKLNTQLSSKPDLQRRWDRATQGKTGIECFDHWACELTETGYLHNHARMWFASIWVFTLELPWELGADFFLRHLLDGDAAANTLSWRWVAGLQTPGKTYLARADNIARYTHGRFHPQGQLSESAAPVKAGSAVPAKPLPTTTQPVTGRRTGLLISEDDLCPETLDLPQTTIAAVAGFTSDYARSPWPIGRQVVEFTRAALDDGLQRTSDRFQVDATCLPTAELSEQVIAWCQRHDLSQLILPYVPVGTTRDTLQPALSALNQQGIHVAQIRREWDELLWPHATRGYFAFKKAVAPLIASYRANLIA